MKRIAILGSTGSIGRNALAIVENHPQEFIVTALAAQENIDLLESQAKKFHPKIIALYNKDKALELQKRLPHITVLGGMEGLCAVAAYHENDLVLSAIAGTHGLAPTVAAIEAKKNVALANKEALVSGGEFVTQLAKKQGVTIIPVDSEHSAIFQCLKNEPNENVRRIVLTASGGPFLTYSDELLRTVNIEQALKHPNWKMGPKITVDCSTLMNKGLEVIEAHWLFNLPLNQIEVIIHPQSIIHCLVEYIDGSMLAQLNDHDMKIPIQYAMTYPERRQGLLAPFDFLKNQTLQFFLPDTKKFRCLQLAFDAIVSGRSMPCFMNAANEVLVNRFINNQISWMEISTKLDNLMSKHICTTLSNLDDILNMDKEARLIATCA